MAQRFWIHKFQSWCCVQFYLQKREMGGYNMTTQFLARWVNEEEKWNWTELITNLVVTWCEPIYRKEKGESITWTLNFQPGGWINRKRKGLESIPKLVATLCVLLTIAKHLCLWLCIFFIILSEYLALYLFCFLLFCYIFLTSSTISFKYIWYLRYVLKRRFDRGSYGEVWLAFHWNCSSDSDTYKSSHKKFYHFASTIQMEESKCSSNANTNSSNKYCFSDQNDDNLFILKRIMVRFSEHTYFMCFNFSESSVRGNLNPFDSSNIQWVKGFWNVTRLERFIQSWVSKISLFIHALSSYFFCTLF